MGSDCISYVIRISVRIWNFTTGFEGRPRRSSIISMRDQFGISHSGVIKGYAGMTDRTNSIPKCSIVVDDNNLCGESPLWDAAEGILYWTDNAASKFYRYDWASKEREVLLDGFEVNGCALDRSGALIFVNNAGIWISDKKKEDPPVLIVDTAETDKLQLNDCIADPQGRLLAGTCHYEATGSYPLGKLISMGQDGKVTILDEGFHLANGLGFSPDGTTLYFSDSIQRTVYRYHYDSLTGRAHDRQVFVQLDKRSGIPDGLTVDAEGFVWLAEWYGGCISRYDPEGKRERQIATGKADVFPKLRRT